MNDQRTVDDLLTEWSDTNEDVSTLESPMVHPAHLVDYANCPVCGKKSIKGCRCRRAEQSCEEGHNWHRCTLKDHNGTIVVTEQNIHDLESSDGHPYLGECSCGMGRTFQCKQP